MIRAVFTNLTQDHLDFHKHLRITWQLNVNYLEQVSKSNQIKSGKGAVINIDDTYGHRVVEKLKHPIITYSIDGSGTLNAHDVDMTPKSSCYTVSYDGHDYTVAMNTTRPV